MSYSERFSHYFSQEVAQKAAKSLSDGSEVEIRVETEILTFTKENGKNAVRAEAAHKPQLVFTLTPGAADGILSDSANDIGTIGVNIAKMVISNDPDKKITVKFKAGFLGLFTHGYFGVITTGGGQFASYLASQGLHGMSGIKNALKKMKD